MKEKTGAGGIGALSLREIAERYPKEEWNHVIAEQKSVPALYHFSHIRENLVSWLDFTGEESVLEIGAGFGALTGALCRKAARVVCTEPSAEGCETIRLRCAADGSPEILKGSFRDAEPLLSERFDYIVLVDWMKEARLYAGGADAYAEFLSVVSGHLKPGGRIILAMANRFGLKYWAGCPEEKSGRLFEGLEGYPDTGEAESLTRKELTGVLERAGGLCASWYYPFPDHHFPMTVYSGRRLPAKGELNRAETGFERLRLQLFQESPVYDSLLDNGLFPEFSNSFLLLIGREEPREEVVYSKFSNERDRKFALRTDICETERGDRFARKVPLTPEAEAHVRNLERIKRELNGLYEKEGLELNCCKMEGKAAWLEYMEGVTLEEKLDRLLAKGETDALEKLLFFYLEKIYRIHSDREFQKTPEFMKVFGDEELPAGLRCGGMSNIDVVPANILINKDKQVVIDYEWTFRFPIPVHFIQYRMIHYYLESDGKRRGLKERDLYGKAGITEMELAAYARMEASFQRYMQGGHVSLPALCEELSPGKAEVLPWYEQLRIAGEERSLQVFFDRGGDFCEEDSVRYPMSRRGISLELSLPENVSRVRLDPGEAAGGLILKKLIFGDGSPAEYRTNGFPLGEGGYYFGGGDPQFVIERLNGQRTLLVEIETIREQEARDAFWKNFSRVSAQKDAQIRRLNQKIREMENTKVWKLYRTIKKK